MSKYVMPVKEGLIDDNFIAKIMKWRHTSGFSVDNSVRIARDDKTGITNLAQYIISSPFSTAKLNYNNDTGMVIYHSRMTHGKNKKNFSISTAEEFIAAITQHIPEKSFQLVRYVGRTATATAATGTIRTAIAYVEKATTSRRPPTTRALRRRLAWL